MAGYSGTPLAKKLGIKPGTALFTIAAPGHYDELLAPLPEGVKRVRKVDDADVAHFFEMSRARMEKDLRAAVPKMRAVDETWSGLKLVIRKQLRKPSGRSAS